MSGSPLAARPAKRPVVIRSSHRISTPAASPEAPTATNKNTALRPRTANQGPTPVPAAPTAASSQNPSMCRPSGGLDDDLDAHQLRRFNKDLIRDNELMLQEIEELRHENDIMFDELERLRKENVTAKERVAELGDSLSGQSAAFGRLNDDIERETKTTEQLQMVFDTLAAARFDNLFLHDAGEFARARRRDPTATENIQLARAALRRSDAQLENVRDIVDSMAQTEFFQNAKDQLVLESTTQIISLCKLVNSTVVAGRCDPPPPPTPSGSGDSRRSSAAGGFLRFFRRQPPPPPVPEAAPDAIGQLVTEMLTARGPCLTARGPQRSPRTPRSGPNSARGSVDELFATRLCASGASPVTARGVASRASLLQRIQAAFNSSRQQAPEMVEEQ